MEYVIPVWMFIFGLIIGSFLNVCIYRIPRGMSVVSPSSSCTTCGTPVRFYDNIPILSYVLLRGKCRACGGPFSIRYPVVEFVAGLLTLCTWIYFGFSLKMFASVLLVYLLIPVVFIDFEYHIIPNSIIIVGLAGGFVFQLTGKLTGTYMGWLDFLGGGLIGSGFLVFAALLGKFLFRKESMGMGDIKLGLVLGLFLGVRDVLVSLFLAFLFAAVLGGGYLLIRREKPAGIIPFGPYLALGSLAGLYFGRDIAQAYFNWIGIM